MLKKQDKSFLVHKRKRRKPFNDAQDFIYFSKMIESNEAIRHTFYDNRKKFKFYLEDVFVGRYRVKDEVIDFYLTKDDNDNMLFTAMKESSELGKNKILFYYKEDVGVKYTEDLDLDNCLFEAIKKHCTFKKFPLDLKKIFEARKIRPSNWFMSTTFIQEKEEKSPPTGKVFSFATNSYIVPRKERRNVSNPA